MLRIAITPPAIFGKESDFITAIIEAGWDYVHLRHPEASLQGMRNLINSIPQCHHNRLKLHDHFELVKEYEIGGLHLNARCKMSPPFYQGKLSRSCHSLDELKENEVMEYVTLSPIFDSTSKVGYKATLSDYDLAKISTRNRVVALGGITPERIKKIYDFNYIGYAVLGYLFEAAEIKSFKERLAKFDTKK